jgi:hypothetical protein
LQCLQRDVAALGMQELREERQVEDGNLGVQQVGQKPHAEQAGRSCRPASARG